MTQAIKDLQCIVAYYTGTEVEADLPLSQYNLTAYDYDNIADEIEDQFGSVVSLEPSMTINDIISQLSI